MTPGFRFNSVDIVITARRLKDILDICRLKHYNDFFANMSMIHNTLFIDGFDLVGTERGSQLDSTNNLSRAMSVWPDEVSDSMASYRIFQYQLGLINCVVVAGVDAEFDTLVTPEYGSVGEENSVKAALDTGDQTASGYNITPRILEYCWLTRTRYLVQGRPGILPGGTSLSSARKTVRDIKVTSVADYFEEWARLPANQSALQWLSWVLRTLRRIALKNDRGKSFILTMPALALDEPDSVSRVGETTPQDLLVSEATHDKSPLSEQDIRTMWNVGNVMFPKPMGALPPQVPQPRAPPKAWPDFSKKKKWV